MTVTSTTYERSFSVSAGQIGPFPVGFRFLAPADLRVTRAFVGGAPVLLTLGPDYTIEGDTYAGAGAVRLTVGAGALSTLTLTRTTPVLQPQVYQQASRFPAVAHERALDRLTMVAQEAQGLTTAAKTAADAAMAKATAAEALAQTVDTAVDALTVEVAASTAAVGAHTAQLAAIDAEVSGHDASIAALSTTQTAFASSQATQDTQIAALASSVAALSGLPDVTAIVITPSSGIISTTPVTYSVSVVSALALLEYQWTFYAPNATVLATSALESPQIVGAAAVTVRVRNATGWSVLASRSVPLGSAAPIVLDITSQLAAGGAVPDPIPLGSVIRFTDVVNAPGTITSWSWSWLVNGSPAGTSTLTQPDYTASQLGELRVRLTVTNAFGTSPQYEEVVGTVGATGVAPSITLHPTGGTITAGQSRTLTVAATGTAPLTYTWRRDGVEIAGATGTSYAATIAGSYTAVVANAFGGATSNAAVVTVIPQPVPSFTATPTSGAAPLNVTLVNTSTNTIVGDIPRWVFGDGQTSSAAGTIVREYTAPGNYTTTLRIERDSVLYGPATQVINATASTVEVVFGGNNSQVAFTFTDSMIYGDPAADDTNYSAQNWAQLVNKSASEYAKFVLRGDINAAAAAYAAANTGTVAPTPTSLVLELYQYVATAAPVTCTIHKLSAVPTISEVTWNNRTTANAWTAPGGDYGASIGTIAIGGAVGAKQSTNLIAEIANIDGGLIIVPPSGMPQTLIRQADSVNNGEPGPKWRVTFPGAGGGGGGGGEFRLATNFAPVYDWQTPEFNNIIDQARGFGPLGTFGEDRTMSRDANAWPLVASTIVVTTAADFTSEFPTGTLQGRYVDNTGTAATMSVRSSANCSISNVVRTGNVVTFDLVVTGSPLLILDFSAGVRDLRIMVPGLSPTATVSILRTEALAYWSQWYGIRYMDLKSTNNNLETWATREPHTKRSGGLKSWGFIAAVASEIYNANPTRCSHHWFCLPHLYHPEADMLALGQYLATVLPPGMVKQCEYGNELWNFGFATQFAYHNGIANNSAHVDYAAINTPSTTDQWTRQARLWMLYAARLARAWKTAFPGDFAAGRLKPIVASHHINPYWLRDIMVPWAQSQLVGEYGALATWCNMLATAPYSGGTEAEMAIPTTAQAFLDSLNGSVGATTTFEYSLPAISTTPFGGNGSMNIWQALADANGVDCGTYETGIHTHDPQNVAIKYAVHLMAGIGPHTTALINAAETAGHVQTTWFHGGSQNYRNDDVNSFSWAIRRGYLPGATTPKLDAVMAILTA